MIDFEVNNDQCFTLLGNSYDFDGKPKMAIEIYDKGLEKFPNSGRLYFEKGIVLEVLKEYNAALESWEKVIFVAPSYPSNYHTAALYYMNYSTEKIWGVMYGELFNNIERGSAKTAEMSKALYDTYQSSITIKSKTEASVSFSKSMQMSLPKDGEEFKFPFSMPYEMVMLLAVTPELNSKELGIQNFSDIRTKFIQQWYDTEKNVEYPNILFDWHKKLIDLGYFEAYNYWLLMKGNEDEFDAWYAKNEERFDDFITWFKANPITIDNANMFSRFQYN